MKFCSSILSLTAIANIVFASSFENSAPLLISSSFDDITDNLNIKEIESIDNINVKIESFINQLTSQHPDFKIAYLKIKNFDESDMTNEFIDVLNNDNNNIVSNHVVFKSIKDTKSLPNESNTVLNIDDINSNINWLESLSDSVSIIELNNDDHLYDNLNKILPAFENNNIIIQGLPTFKEPSNSNQVLSQESLKLINDLSKKREDVNYETIEQEMKDTFEEVYELLDDQLVSAYNNNEEDEEVLTQSSRSSSPIVVDGSLFDKYAFFSNGIWMGTIVFLSLAWILSVALGWLNSMKISYAAFNKPFDFEKKLQ